MIGARASGYRSSFDLDKISCSYQERGEKNYILDVGRFESRAAFIRTASVSFGIERKNVKHMVISEA